MSEAVLHVAPAPVESPCATVLADAPEHGRHASRLLTDAGFAVVSSPLHGPRLASPGAPDLVVLLLTCGARARVAEIKDAADGDARVVASMPADARSKELHDALRAGARGIVLDDSIDSTLGPTAWAVAAGQLALPPVLRRRLAPRALSYREKEILSLVVRGYTNRQIASTLFVAESTVKTHLSSAFDKLDARSRSEAAALILDPAEGDRFGVLAIPDPAAPQPA